MLTVLTQCVSHHFIATRETRHDIYLDTGSLAYLLCVDYTTKSMAKAQI